MDMRKYLDLFVAEANEHIQGALRETGRLGEGHVPPESLNALFRHFHSIKGMAASMGFEQITAISHAAEDLFDQVRKGALRPDDALIDMTMEALDAMASMVAEAGAVGPGARLTFDPDPLAARLRALIGPADRPDPAPRATSGPPVARVAEAGPVAREPRHTYRCVIAVDSRADMPGARAALVLQRLEQLGEILGTSPRRERLAEPGFDGEMIVRLASHRPQAALVAVVADLLDLKLFEVAEVATCSGAEPAPAGAAAAEAPSSVRVPTSALDLFLDAIAELVSRRGTLAEAVRTGDQAEAGVTLQRMTASIQSLRDQVMLIRLIPFDHITPRLTRAVRELCRATGKRAALHITGAGIAVDRSVLEEIVDPLMHVLRNAVDHGIRAPEERERSGKPATGSLRLEVSRLGDGVQILVEDDGEGMDVEAIRRGALERGFRTTEQLATMDEEEILMLTTVPGFSTATRVTEVSGRGVGMDIVRTRVEALRGHMAVRSRRGVGTRIELMLPITVAILDAFLVESGRQVFAVPASTVQSVQLVGRSRIRSTLSGRFLATTGEGSTATFTPLLMLDEALQCRRDHRPRPPEIPVLSYRAAGTSGALAVERILGRREVVVKPLGPPLESLRRYSGAALLDDGRLALVLDLANFAS
ncbi:MAG: ATP-binding protein [Candidatus Polarisedimenticolia bacterium]